jgi:hypothetical protein
MSSRLTYANGAASLVDWIRECEQMTPELKGDDAAIEFIAAWLSNPDPERSSLQKLCGAYGLNWGVLAGWIRRDPVRNARFQQAMADRDAFRKERLLDGWWQTAEQKPEDVVTHGDVHKARESLAKAVGVFTEQKVQVDTQITIVHRSE